MSTLVGLPRTFREMHGLAQFEKNKGLQAFFSKRKEMNRFADANSDHQLPGIFY